MAAAAACVVATQTPAAVADDGPSTLTSYLCSSQEVPCQIYASAAREGAPLEITVTGRRFATVSVQVFRLELQGSEIVGMAALRPDPVTVSLDDRGYGEASYPMAPFADGVGAGWALVSLSDAEWGDPDQILGTFVALQGRAPLLLGDGYGHEKPVGIVLDLDFVNFIPGSEFTVEYLGDDGSWRAAIAGEVERLDADQPVGRVNYEVPNGLQARPYRFRLHNLTDTGGSDPEWLVTPATTALQQPRLEPFAGPALGSGIGTAQAPAIYRSPVQTPALAMAIISVGLIALVLWPAGVIAARRPREHR